MDQKITLRSIFIGAALSIIIALSSVYLALRMNAFYWASILTSLLSIILLKISQFITGNRTNIHEINIAQTIASTGGILAAGICFTIPALHFLDKKLFSEMINFPIRFSIKIFFIAMIGGNLGVIFSSVLRKTMIEDLKLPFPTGIAAADTIRTMERFGDGIWQLTGALGFAAIFTTLRDGLSGFVKSIIPLYVGRSIHGFNFQMGLIPMTIGGGYLVGARTALLWFLGCLVSNWIYQPILVNWLNVTPDNLNLQYILPLGVGIVIGSGLFIIGRTLLPSWISTLKLMLLIFLSRSRALKMFC